MVIEEGSDQRMDEPRIPIPTNTANARLLIYKPSENDVGLPFPFAVALWVLCPT